VLTESNGTTPLTNGSATLRTTNWTYSQYQYAGSDGRVTFSDVPAGSYLLDISSWSTTSFAPAPQAVTVVEGQATDLGTIALLPPNIFIKVVKSDGTTPVGNASITVRTSDWSSSRWGYTDVNGLFQHALINQGAYVVEVYTYDSEESRPENTSITYSGAPVYLDGTNSSQPLRTITAAMRGRVMIPGSLPAQYASVALYDSNNMSVQWTSTNDNGYFKIDSVATGTYRLRIMPPYTPTGLSSPDDITVSLVKGTLNTEFLTNPIVLTQSVKLISGRITRSSGGAAITDANISAWQPMGGGYANATTNANGEFSLLVGSGGAWEISIWPTYSYGTQPDWTYAGGPKRIQFSLPRTETETATANFSVATLSATLQGTILKPDGTAINGTSTWASVSVWSDRGYGGGGWSQVNSAGWYTIKLAAGTYNVSVYGPSEYGSTQSAITIKENETLTHNVALLEKNATIAGVVQNDQGNAIASQWCSAWMKSGSGWSSGTSGSDGRYSMRVTPGTWMVNCYPSGGTQASSIATIQSTSVSYVSTDPPKEVTVAANGTATADFLFDIADATISGKLVDQNGADVTTVWGWVNARKCSSTTSGFDYYGGLGGSINGGAFTIRVPGGCWRLRASVGYSGDYSSSSVGAQDITIASGETSSAVQLQLIPNNATISGSVVDTNGNVLTGAYGSVMLTDGANYRWTQIQDGTYSVKTSAGTWSFGCWLDYTTTSEYYMDGVCERTATATANTTTTQNITLQKTDSAITITTKKPNGDPLPNAHVSASTSFGATKTVSYGYYGWWFQPDTMTDQNGQATLHVPAGTYFISASISTDFGYINPPRKTVTVSADAPGIIEMQFVQPDAVITGTVTKDGAAYTGGGTITGYNTNGGYSETDVESDGEYSLPVTKGDRWVVSAGDDASSTTGYTSGDTAIDVSSDGTETASIALDEMVAMPAPTTVTFSTNTEQTVTTSDVSVNAPANSLTTSNITATLSVTATVEDRPSTATDAPIGPAYDITANQASGQNAGTPITDLANSVTVTLPYTDTDLQNAGVTDESLLTAKSWDQTTDSYSDVQGVVVNESLNTISFSSSHLSKFVITVAPVEKTSTPPSVPGGDTIPILTPDTDVTELKTRDLVALYGTKGPTIVVYTSDGLVKKRFQPYGSKTEGSFRLLAADVLASREGEELVVYSPTNANLPVKIYTVTGRLLGKITPEKGTQVEVTSADLDGNRAAELVLAGQGARTATVYRFSGAKIVKSATIKPTRSRTGLQVFAGSFTSISSDQLAIVPYGGDWISLYTVNLRTKKAKAVKTIANVSFSSGDRRVSLGDVTGSALKEVVVWPRTGVNIVRIIGLNAKGSFTTLSNTKVTNALALTLGDVDGNGKTDILAVTASKGKSSVKMLSMKGGVMQTRVLSTSVSANAKVSPMNIAVADLNADGVRDVVVSQQQSSLVTVFSYQTGKKTLKRVTQAYIGARTSKRGYNLYTTDTDADGRRELILSPVSTGKTVLILRFSNGKLSITKQLKPSSKNVGPFIVTSAGTQ
jgi:hypothetical protein